MTDEIRAIHEEIIRKDTNEQLINRFAWYVQNFNPVDEERCEDYEIIKAEMKKRMTKA